MKEKLKKYFKEVAIFAVVIIIAMNVISYYKSLDLNKEKLDIQSFKLLNNNIYTLPIDKPVLIHFWATWCPICKVESSNIEKISKGYEVVTIATQSGSTQEIKSYLKKHKLSFKVVNDIDGVYSRKFNVKAFPTTFIYNKDKELTFTEVGYTTSLGLYFRMLFSK